MLTLRIENETKLPDGGPLSISVEGTRGIDIGRDQHLDWTLPDPNRFISGKHCEIRWQDGAFWLHDVSTNGTFLYGSDGRLKAAHKLRDGDRFLIGHYIIVANISGQPIKSAPENSNSSPPDYDNLWAPVGEAAPPIEARKLKASRDLQPVKPDFLDWAVDLQPPRPGSASQPLFPFDRNEATPDEWARSSPKPFAPEPALAAAIPNPRRPVWVTGEPAGAWAGSAASTQPAPPQPSTAGEPDPYDIPTGNAHTGNTDLVRLIARSAGLPDNAFAASSPEQLAEELGQLLRLVTENMRQLLEARQQAKRLARSSNQTTVQAFDNNPLKFAPTVEEALRIMFGPRTKSYLGASSAIAQGFDDLKTHQIITFSAMQHALKRLLDDFAPEQIEKGSSGKRGFLALGSSRAACWDAFSERWKAHTRGQEDGMLDTFMRYFAEYYDRGGKSV